MPIDARSGPPADEPGFEHRPLPQDLAADRDADEEYGTPGETDTGWGETADARIDGTEFFEEHSNDSAGDGGAETGSDVGASVYDRIEAARRDLLALETDLNAVSVRLSTIALSTGEQRNAIRQLIGTLRAFVDAGPDQPPDLAFSATAQYSALDSDLEEAATSADDATARSGAVSQAWAWIKKTLKRGWARLWSLISHLTKVKEWSVSGTIGTGLLGFAQAQISVTFGS